MVIVLVIVFKWSQILSLQYLKFVFKRLYYIFIAKRIVTNMTFRFKILIYRATIKKIARFVKVGQ